MRTPHLFAPFCLYKPLYEPLQERLQRYLITWRESAMEEIEKLKVDYKDGEVETWGNRAGLRGLGELCLGLSELSAEQAKTPANHYHIEECMNNAEPGSVPLIITLKLDL